MVRPNTATLKLSRMRLCFTGIVQGVGFRPFVYRLARQEGLGGFVRNTGAGVTIEIEGPPESVQTFIRDVSAQAPPLAKVTGISSKTLPIAGDREFKIIASQGEQQRSALISPDIALCADCLRELFDPSDRRYRYPFINCTNCGPRYTIVQDIPYDRRNTTMRVFPMCPACEAEYHDPANRRFHAQPNACPLCGPRIWMAKAGEVDALAVPNDSRADTGRVLMEAIGLLRSGAILAIKGIGGFHLAVDAANEAAVRRLRARKHREEKALAVMSADLSAIRQYARVSEAEEQLLTGIQRPIVLLQKRRPAPIAESVAPRSKHFGVMLPYTPLHYLIFSTSEKDVQGGAPGPGVLALVMTSGNLSEEPIAIDNAEAMSRLGGIADYFLLHNRDIFLRADDSVARVDEGRPVILRRSRGYAPVPVPLKTASESSVLAVGAELKNTVCLSKGENAFVSQHIGDLKNVAECEFFEMTVRHLKTIFEIVPGVIAHDLHPDYRSTRYALSQEGVRKVAVQHHHAHIASCLAEHGRDERVIGLAFDGTGYGADGKIWGGEFLLADCAEYRRVGHFRYVPMPGGDRAVKEPDRMALACLYAVFGDATPTLDLGVVKRLGATTVHNLLAMIRTGLNAPETSSVGRIFDAVSALTDVCHRANYEGQPAIELESIADPLCREAYPFELLGESPLVVDLAPMFRKMVEDLQAGCPQVPSVAARIAAKLHNTVAEAALEVCLRLRGRYGINTVALSGGVFQNQLLSSRLTALLRERRFEVLRHREIPPNDGGISLGQTVVALRQTRGLAERGSNKALAAEV